MKPRESTALTIEQVQEMVRRELSTPSRIIYLLFFLVTLTAAALVGTLWLSEPGPLPMRTHVAFGLLAIVNLAWSSLFGWVLARRKVLFAMHRVIAGWMALLFCGVFLLFGLSIALMKVNLTAIVAVGLVGAAQVIAAVVVLRRARHHRGLLLARRDELTGAIARYRSA
jgi:hypothetical protein